MEIYHHKVIFTIYSLSSSTRKWNQPLHDNEKNHHAADADADAENDDDDHIEGGDANIVDNGALKCFATDHDTHLNQSHPFAS